MTVTPAQLRRGFGPIYRYLSRSGDDLSAPAKLVLLNLLERLGQSSWANPRQERIARDTGYGERSVRAALDELVSLGFVSTKRLGLGKSNVYTLDIERILDWAEAGLGATTAGAFTAGSEPTFLAGQELSTFAAPEPQRIAPLERAVSAAPNGRTTKEEPPKKNHQEKAAAAARPDDFANRCEFLRSNNPACPPSTEDETTIQELAASHSLAELEEAVRECPRRGLRPYPSNISASLRQTAEPAMPANVSQFSVNRRDEAIRRLQRENPTLSRGEAEAEIDRQGEASREFRTVPA